MQDEPTKKIKSIQEIEVTKSCKFHSEIDNWFIFYSSYLYNGRKSNDYIAYPTNHLGDEGYMICRQSLKTLKKEIKFDE